MSHKKVFPQTSLKTVDVFAVKGAVNSGCFVANGRLEPAMSFIAVNRLTEKATAAWYVGVLKKYFLLTKTRLHVADGALNSSWSVGFSANNPSLVETHTSVGPIAYVIGETSYYRIGSTTYFGDFDGEVHSCVLKNGRIFGIDNANTHKIKWSGTDGINDWTEEISGSGWTVVQNGYGEILNLIVYRDKIVALREYGLTFLTAYGNPENFKLSYYESKLPKICQNTAAVAGDKLVFYTEDGLYFFDGSRVEKCTFELAEEIKSPTAVCGAKGKYFLCGTSKTLNKKVVFVFDAIRNSSYIVEVAANAVGAGDKIFAYTDTYEYRLDDGGAFTYTSGELDFSSRKAKVLKEVILDDAEDVEIEVSNGGSWRILWGVRGKFRPNMRGKSFKIRVRANKRINGLSAVAEVPDGV